MLETYKTLRQTADLYKGDEDLTELAMIYQKDQSPVLLAKVFTKMFPFLLKISNKYFNINEADKASLVLMEVHKAMMAYEPTHGAKVQTLINAYVNRRLYAETSAMNCDVRSANTISDSYEVKVEEHHEESEEEFAYSDILFKQSLSKLNLNETEQAYCYIIMKEEKIIKDSDMARMLDISPAGINYLRKRLAQKLNPIIQY